MSVRPYFTPLRERIGYRTEISPQFSWSGGFALTQKQKNIRALHDAIARHRGAEFRVLEVSAASESGLGRICGAHTLVLHPTPPGCEVPLENVFQCAKIFVSKNVNDNDGTLPLELPESNTSDLTVGPFPDLLTIPPKAVKKALSERILEAAGYAPTDQNQLNESKRRAITATFHLSSFRTPDGTDYAIFPKEAFYFFLYAFAVDRMLRKAPERFEELCGYQAFTDIAFNPTRSVNCQAAALAFYLSLRTVDPDRCEAIFRSPSINGNRHSIDTRREAFYTLMREALAYGGIGTAAVSEPH